MYLTRIRELGQIIIQRDAQIAIMSYQLKQKSQSIDIGQLKSEIEHLSDSLKTTKESQIVNSRQLTETNLQFESMIKQSLAKFERFTSELQKFTDKNETELDEKDKEIARLKQENNRLKKEAENAQSQLKRCEEIFHKLTDIIEHLQKQSQYRSEEVVRCNLKRPSTGSTKTETCKKRLTEQQLEVIDKTNPEKLPNSAAHQDNSSQVEKRIETTSGTSQPTMPISGDVDSDQSMLIDDLHNNDGDDEIEDDYNDEDVQIDSKNMRSRTNSMEY